LVIPATDIVTDVFAGSEQPAGRVTVTSPPAADAVGLEQVPVNPRRVTAGDPGMVNSGSNCANTFMPGVSPPLALLVSPTVQGTVLPAVCGVAENVTGAGDVAAAITTGEAGAAATVSELVATFNVL
jgi:hypothetical protein